MPEPTLLTDVINPAWAALTAEQRTCWHFWALAHPRANLAAKLQALYGKQAHYSYNADAARAELTLPLTSPPTATTPPVQVIIRANGLSMKTKLPDGTVHRYGIAWINLPHKVPGDSLIIIKQSYTRKRAPQKRPARTRHVRVVTVDEEGNILLTSPNGYYASTAGNNRFATIKGRTARRRPDLPFARYKIVRLSTGTYEIRTIPNPFGGNRRKTNRARATQVNPKTPDHYP